MQEKSKICFLISPIGEDGTEEHALADCFKAFVQYEILDNLGYKCIRADDINKMGHITTDIIKMILDSDLVIALLEYRNANVYYELALRHATNKPCASVISRESLKDNKLPFDINQERAMKFPLEAMKTYVSGKSITDHDLIIFKEKMRDMIAQYETEQYVIVNPITVATKEVLLPTEIELSTVTNDIRSYIERYASGLSSQIQEMSLAINKQIASLNTIVKDWMPGDLKQAVEDMYNNGSATYIEGEDQAFAKLTEMTLKATTSLRTSRFAPQAIGTSHSDFFEAVCSFGKRKDVTCKRIICINEDEKDVDILKTVLDTLGGSMELYLTGWDNNFELVVIDDLCAFLHFYDNERRIKSTLFIKGKNVVNEFQRIYDRFVEKADEKMTLKIASANYQDYSKAMVEIPQLINAFKERIKRNA